MPAFCESFGLLVSGINSGQGLFHRYGTAIIVSKQTSGRKARQTRQTATPITVAFCKKGLLFFL